VVLRPHHRLVLPLATERASASISAVRARPLLCTTWQSLAARQAPHCGATERRSSFLARFFVCRCDANAIERGGKYRPQDLALTSMQINGKMVVLAREIRGMTQQYLASRLSMSLYALSRVERHLVEAVSNQEALTLADALEFPVEFFRQDGAPRIRGGPMLPRRQDRARRGRPEAGSRRIDRIAHQHRQTARYGEDRPLP